MDAANVLSNFSLMVDVVFVRAFGSWLIVLLNIVFTYKQNESELIILIIVNYNGEFVKNLATFLSSVV